MFRNYLKIAWRNLSRYKFISFINIFGLSVGLACCMLILVYILNELSYDKYQPHADRVYRVTRTFINPETKDVNLELGTVAPPFGPLLKNDFGEIEAMTRLLMSPPNGYPVRYEDKMFTETKAFWADSNFFNFFKMKLTSGYDRKALNDPFSVMLTKDIARKYFGEEDPMNKTLRINFGNYFDFKVTGVFEPLPSNTHFHPEIMLSFNTLNDTPYLWCEKTFATNWGNNSFFTYIRLPKGYDPNKLKAQFPAFLDKHMADQ